MGKKYYDNRGREVKKKPRVFRSIVLATSLLFILIMVFLIPAMIKNPDGAKLVVESVELLFDEDATQTRINSDFSKDFHVLNKNLPTVLESESAQYKILDISRKEYDRSKSGYALFVDMEFTNLSKEMINPNKAFAFDFEPSQTDGITTEPITKQYAPNDVKVDMNSINVNPGATYRTTMIYQLNEKNGMVVFSDTWSVDDEPGYLWEL